MRRSRRPHPIADASLHWDPIVKRVSLESRSSALQRAAAFIGAFG
jgi:hypothetical protein